MRKQTIARTSTHANKIYIHTHTFVTPPKKSLVFVFDKTKKKVKKNLADIPYLN